MNGFGTRRRKWRDGVIECCERRECLSTVAFETHLVECCSALGTHSVAVGDADGDNDLDLFVASWQDNTVAWYANLDGAGRFGAKRVISNRVAGANAIQVADLDRDGRLDVIVSASLANRIVWFRNEDGRGTFTPPQTVANAIIQPNSIEIADMDGDGDGDILTTSAVQGSVLWIRNEAGSFEAARTIQSRAPGSAAVIASDLDGDADLDFISASQGTNAVLWFQNRDGQGGIGDSNAITRESGRPFSLAAGDMDGDGDHDVLVASFADDTIAWYENRDGRGTFGERQAISLTARGAAFVSIADLDHDGDLDVISASYSNDTVAWHENEGGAGRVTFGPTRVVSDRVNGAREVLAADLDRDGDLDLVSTGFASGQLAWHENRVLGDINRDGLFDSADLILALANGAYDRSDDDSVSFDEGDWNGDGRFDSADLVWAFQAGHYR